ncbi:MAG: GNAT family N-acetyltransferase [Pseudoalteromonas prydzensis]|uniref:GNAT family N-acetyltransferase n=1 Tax=Pseudoalteromonas prydzensis TaxID=182141 RepID=UPI003F984631
MLRLRRFKTDDALLLINYLNNPEVMQFLSPKIPTPYTIDDARWWIETGSKAGHTFAIELSGHFVGCIGAVAGEFEYSKSAEVGYWLAQEYWGQAIVSQAIALLIEKIQQNNDIVRLHAVVFEGNTRSAKVLEKVGFAQEGCLHKAIYKQGDFHNALVYGKVIA